MSEKHKFIQVSVSEASSQHYGLTYTIVALRDDGVAFFRYYPTVSDRKCSDWIKLPPCPQDDET